MKVQSSVDPASRPTPRALRLAWLSGLTAVPAHVPVLTAVEAAATSAAPSAPRGATSRLSGFPGLGAVATHVAVLPAVEAGSASTTPASASATATLLGLSALATHVTILTTVEAATASAAATSATSTAATTFSAATLLAPANADGPATDAVAVELRDGLLSVALVVEVHESKGPLEECHA